MAAAGQFGVCFPPRVSEGRGRRKGHFPKIQAFSIQGGAAAIIQGVGGRRSIQDRRLPFKGEDAYSRDKAAAGQL